MLKDTIERAGLAGVAEKVLAGERLTGEDGLRLYRSPDLNVVGWLGNTVRERLHGDFAYYVRNQHINYTNVCDKACRFCSFRARKDGPAPYVLSIEDVRERIRHHRDQPVTEIHVVGGIHPGLPYAYYLDLLRAIREERPGVHVKAFTMIELQQIRQAAGKPLEEVLQELKDAGLGSVPGGGIEVLSDRLHGELFGRKLDGREWLATARATHRAGLRSNATMLYGHLERDDERVEHLVRLRELQDETGGFLTFIPLSFHPERTPLSHLPGPTGCDDLRAIAVSRLMLDNFPHIKAFWVMSSVPVAQAALWYGADDIDGTVLRYEVTRDARKDTRQRLTQEQLVALIREAGRVPVERVWEYGGRDGRRETGDGSTQEYRSIGVWEYGGRDRRREKGDGSGQVPAVSGLRSPVSGPPSRPQHSHTPFEAAAARAAGGARLTAEDGIALLQHPDLPELGALATIARFRMNPERAVTYVVGRNINTTNVCWVQCRFCTFHRRGGSDESYVLPREEIHRKIEEVVALGGTEILMQGGLNPQLKLEWYEDLFRDIKARFPVHLHSLSPTEVLYLARMADLSVEAALTRLREAGLDSLPGGGAELLVESVRERISPRKHSPAEWLGVMRAAHRLGMPTTATMVYGFGETMAQRVEHLLRIRDLQDETGGFTAFIAWSFQPEGSELGGAAASGYDYLRTVAAARLLLDNIDHIQASWLTQGPKIGQIALHYGVDDFGSTVIEENVISAGNSPFLMPIAETERLIHAAGFEPRRRDTLYRVQSEW